MELTLGHRLHLCYYILETRFPHRNIALVDAVWVRLLGARTLDATNHPP